MRSFAARAIKALAAQAALNRRAGFCILNRGGPGVCKKVRRVYILKQYRGTGDQR